MSGIQLASDVVSKYNNFKLNKNVRYLALKINDSKTEVVVEKEVEKTDDPKADFEAFYAQLPKKEPRYYCFDFEYTKSGTDGKRAKLVFILWAPDSSPIMGKMLYTSTKDTVKKQLVGLVNEVQANDFDEITYDLVMDRVDRK
eukprot:TRINITY_DN13126_c0_g1_i1.p1 TRINITY_DN13126_c0_g1~~TRINITY_DN13126_c0_g1_i1.p1  ORF type:complete len:143 (-),score=34.45 TRINITY_DN13126_c0_g1_i1:85-513(-)